VNAEQIATQIDRVQRRLIPRAVRKLIDAYEGKQPMLRQGKDHRDNKNFAALVEFAAAAQTLDELRDALLSSPRFGDLVQTLDTFRLASHLLREGDLEADANWREASDLHIARDVLACRLRVWTALHARAQGTPP